MTGFYPVFLDLQGKKCLVVGGGRVAARKVTTLLNCGAAVTVVSPTLIPELQQLVAAKAVAYYQEPYKREHLEGAFLVISATDDKGSNSIIAADCFARNILVNVADNPALCNFYVPSLVNRGSLSIAVSTGGKSPAFARRMREELEQSYSELHGEFVEFLGKLRPLIMEQVPDPKCRKALFRELAGEDFFAMFKNLSSSQLEKKAGEIINRYRS